MNCCGQGFIGWLGWSKASEGRYLLLQGVHVVFGYGCPLCADWGSFTHGRECHF